MCKSKISLALGISMLPIAVMLLPVTLSILFAANAWEKRRVNK